MIGKRRHLVGAVADVGRYVNLLDVACGESGCATAFLDRHAERSLGYSTDRSDLKNLRRDVCRVDRLSNGTVNKIFLRDGGGGRLQARPAADCRREGVQHGRNGIANGTRDDTGCELNRHELAQTCNRVVLLRAAVVRSRLENRIADRRIVAVGKNMVVGEDVERVVLLDKASQRSGRNQVVSNAYAAGRRPMTLGAALLRVDDSGGVHIGRNALNTLRNQVGGSEGS